MCVLGAFAHVQITCSFSCSMRSVYSIKCFPLLCPVCDRFCVFIFNMESFFRLLVLVFLLNVQQSRAAYNVDPNSVSVSGFSSGGAMSMQFHLAHSSLLQGVGIFGGLPYGCGFFSNSSTCHETSDADYVDLIRTHAWLGNLDPLENVKGDEVFVFHGALDSGINPELGVKMANIYRTLGARVTTSFMIQAEHGFPTESYGTQCDVNSVQTGFLNNCSYNGAYDTLNAFYGGDLQKPQPGDTADGELSLFDQSPFIPPGYNSPSEISLDTSGFMYVPSKCDSDSVCRLHVALHGCQQSRGLINDVFVKNAGYIEVAELNNIIIVFPQAAPSLDTPNGCWNWWGYLEGSDYLTNKSPQIQTLYNIVTFFL